MQTTVIFKADKKLKERAQQTAKSFGIPFSAVLNELMKDFVERQEITFFANDLKRKAYFEMVQEALREKESREQNK
jgi:antitoxin component of RelBE/YafQ-DinJ toxin-antitoxin module